MTNEVMFKRAGNKQVNRVNNLDLVITKSSCIRNIQYLHTLKQGGNPFLSIGPQSSLDLDFLV